MIDRPQILMTTAQTTAVIHLTVGMQETRTVMGPGLRELMTAVAAQGVATTGPWFNRHLRRPGVTVDFEISVPVARAIAPAGRVEPSELPPTRVARAIHRGGYEGLASAWGELHDWIRANGHTPAESLWECYVAGPEAGLAPEEFRTELNQPLID